MAQTSLVKMQNIEVQIDDLLEKAEQQRLHKQWLEAVETWKKVLVIAQQASNSELEALAFFWLAVNYENANELNYALDNYAQALPILKSLEEFSLEATTLFYMGFIYYNKGIFTKALKYYNQALNLRNNQIDNDQDNQIEKAVINNNLGEVYRDQMQFNEALKHYQEALKVFQQFEMDKETASVLNNLGLLYDSHGELEQAFNHLSQSLTIRQSVNDISGKAESLNNLGAFFKRIGKKKEALDNYQQALIIYQTKVIDINGEAATLANLGEIFITLGQYQKALFNYNKALNLMQKTENAFGEAEVLNGIGLIFKNTKEPQEALINYQKALDIFIKYEQKIGEANTRNNIGEVYRNIGKPQKALDYYQQALNTLENVPDDAVTAIVLNSFGVLYQEIGNFQKALVYHQQALPIRKRNHDIEGSATTLNNIGLIYENLEKLDEALIYYQESLDILNKIKNPQKKAITLNNFGGVYSKKRQYTNALNYYQQSLTIFQKIKHQTGEAVSLNNIGEVYHSLENFNKSLEYYQKSVEIIDRLEDKLRQVTVLSNVGLVHQKNNQITKAISNWEKSIQITLKMRGNLLRNNRNSFLEIKQGAAIALTNLLIEQNKAEQAYEWVNRFTTFELANYTRLVEAKVANPQAQLAVDEWNQKTQQLTNLYEQLNQQIDDFFQSSPKLSQQIRSLEAEVNQLAENTIDQFPEIAELLETTPEDINKLRANLPSDTVVIQPVLLTDNNIDNVPNSIAVFILSKDQPLTVTQVSINPKEFDDLISQYRNKLQNRRARGYKSVGGELYDLLIRPVEEQIKTLSPNRIAIIPTGKLRYIPFETLYDQQTKQYLIEKYPVHYLTRLSVNSLESEKQAISNQQGILALGNPVPVEPYSLPGAEAEVESISQILPGSEKYVGKKATLDTFKFQGLQFPFLHLATHGCFQPEGCCFKSEGCSPNDMDMEANTILFANQNSFHIRDAALLGMKNVELITLSACQTALKADSDGREIAGLAYLFERAGAKAVMASLWGADDETTKEIMVQFYQNLDQGMSKVDALREAKLKHTKRHPFYWSPFILVGNGN
ncbi:CHAT domain-containing protein [Waterburya agarophytonicola K14]|uniref:CHAT domain-containing protein n=1 Tax=Waterburya agarophytonicola KI4 TaxID=2874699 RepID=A0A964BVC0_9CYAN|nr:CHAT domain-containing tetratricopeptide repeat protein [Waterburya agarophytonicola]MCC0178757.1 CHAT domain-containing protein [Waterburya agarophytonicola KI4]